MTWATLAASGRGQIVLWLRIAGIEWIFSTENLEPNTADTWYWSGGVTRLFSGVKPWWRWGGMTIEERASFLEGTCDVAGFPVEISDVGGGFTALVKSWRGLLMTRLTQSYTTGQNHVHVDCPDAFPATGNIYIGLDAYSYSGKVAGSPGQFTGLAPIYASLDIDHEVDADAFPVPVHPAVLSGPQVLGGRRADVYAATVVDGVVSTGECIYRGYLAQDIEAEGGVFKLQVEHITKLWSRKVCQTMPQTALKPGYWYSGDSMRSFVSIVEGDTSASPTTHIWAYPYINGGLYVSDDDLALTLNAEMHVEQVAQGFTRFVGLAHTADGVRCLQASANTDFEIVVGVNKGDPLWCLGFDEGVYTFPPSAVNTHQEATRDPIKFFMELPDASWTMEAPIIEVYDGGDLRTGRSISVAGSPSMEIASKTGDFITITANSLDPTYHNRIRRSGEYWIAIEEDADMVVKHVLAMGGGALTTALERLCGIGGLDPVDWVVTGFRSGDISAVGGELADCLSDPMVPIPLAHVTGAIESPVTVAEFMCDRLGVLGIVPRIIADGVIGFARLRTPDADSADSVEVDEDIWSLLEASRVTTQIEGEPLLNQIKLLHSYDYTGGGFAPEARINYEDGRAILGKTRCKTYQLRGVWVDESAPYGSYQSETDLVLDVAQYAIGTHFNLFGRVAPVVSIPSTWTSRQLLVGDVVLVTHPCIVDTTLGEVGVTSRVGIIVGRRHAVTSTMGDALLVQFPPETLAGRITPAALATAWDAVNLELDVPTTNIYARTGETDLDYFEAGYQVLLVQYDESVPLVFGPAEIDSVAANTIVLTADPFGGAFPADGVVVVYADYDDCVAAQQVRWLFFADGSYTLGAAADEGHQWGT